MTPDKTPMDVELDSIDMGAKAKANQNPIGTPAAWRNAYLAAFANAVLARWGAPVVAGEPAGRVYSANCEYAVVQWLRQTSDVGGGDPKNSWSWPITGDAVYLTPQPTQAQAVPLTPEQIATAGEIEDNDSAFLAGFSTGVQFAEQHHGIKGGQHGTE